MNNPLSAENLGARIAARTQALQTMRIEAAYPELGELDREALDDARGVLVRLNRRDEKRLDENEKEISPNG